MSDLKNRPVFVHSLFRAGSTYIFSVFRRSDSGYWCYQEPMSEFVLSARNERESMLAADDNLARMLRHPNVQGAYYSELYNVSDECTSKLNESCIYDGYFSTDPEQAGVPYLSGLISSAQGRAFIQECRTSSRIGVIKKALGGCHIYLWRNPWDQWWSYKVDHYFDDASQMCINGSNHPEAITRLIAEVGFTGMVEGSIYDKFSWFFRNRLSPDNSYLVFYILWFLGLKEGLDQSELQINIDRLSDSLEYKKQITNALEDKGVGGVDFSDCSVPQAVYGTKDRSFFQRLEERAHEILLHSGTSQDVIDEIIALRKISEPLVWQSNLILEANSGLIRDAERARELVMLIEQRGVDARIGYDHQLIAARERCASAEAKLIASDARIAVSEAKCAELDRKRLQLEGERLKLEKKLSSCELKLERSKLESKALVAENERKMHEILTSASWRLTRPLRILKRWIKEQGVNFRASPLLNIKHGLKSFISYLIRAAITSPMVKAWAIRFLAHRPVLKARLKRMAWGRQQNKNSASSSLLATVELSPSSTQSLKLKKKGTCDELKSPLESFFY